MQKFKVLVINLDSSVDRWNRINDDLIGYEVHRIDALNGKELSDQIIAKYYDALANYRNYYKNLSLGEIGCYLSHRKAWQYIVDNELEYAVVCEDDINIKANLDTALEALISSGLKWHCLKLAEYPIKRASFPIKSISGFDLVQYDKIPIRACAQVISFEGAVRLLQYSETFSRPVDVDIQHWWEMDIKVLGLKPYVFEPITSEKSDIDSVANRDEVRARRVVRIFQQLRFLVINWYKTKTQSF